MDYDFNDLPDNLDDDEPDDKQTGLPFLGRVRLALDGSIIAKVFADVSRSAISISRVVLTELKGLLGIGDTPSERLFNRLYNPDFNISAEFVKSDKVRGPYYGKDQLMSALTGMRAAHSYIVGIYSDGDENSNDTAFYVEFDK